MTTTEKMREEFEEVFAEKLGEGVFTLMNDSVGDIEDWWLSKFSSHLAELEKEVEGEKVDETFKSSWHRENAKGYNEALDSVLSLIRGMRG